MPPANYGKLHPEISGWRVWACLVGEEPQLPRHVIATLHLHMATVF